MIKKDKKEVIFLFGAGAELDYEICSGQEFIKILLKTEYLKERIIILGNNRVSYNLIAPSSQKFFWRTINENKEDAKKIFEEKVFILCNEFYTAEKDKDIHTKYVKERREYCSQWYNIVVKGEVNKNTEKIKNFFFSKGCFFDCLDEKFNDLRMTTENNSNINRLANSFYAIFIKMLKSLYKDINSWKLQNIINLLQHDYDNDAVKNAKDTYYSILAKYDFERSVFTTNYTMLADMSMHKHSDNNVYRLHGSLKWFENPKNLRFMI